MILYQRYSQCQLDYRYDKIFLIQMVIQSLPTYHLYKLSEFPSIFLLYSTSRLIEKALSFHLQPLHRHCSRRTSCALNWLSELRNMADIPSRATRYSQVGRTCILSGPLLVLCQVDTECILSAVGLQPIQGRGPNSSYRAHRQG